ncbi:MAG: glycosyltransferase family 2 protein [Chloroflexota bacterium]|nr:glycosyltransferase family 2 protein [Chloroflexota bacterium]
MIVLHLLFFVVTLVIAGGLAYHYFLLIAGKPQQAGDIDELPQPNLRFALAVPAHDEEDVIAATVRQMQEIDYPERLFDVHVVADHCSDDTAVVAEDAGATAHLRTDEPSGRKGFAVDWLIKRLLADPIGYDIIAVFDADSKVDSLFLTAVSHVLADGSRVVQGKHVIANPDSSMFSTLADADMKLNNRIRNQAKENLGLSARLMGDAMVFRRGILDEQSWIGAESLAEDRDFGIFLVTQGVRIRFAPDAVSEGQAVTAWADATPQRMRWYGGAFDLQKRYLGKLGSLVVSEGNLDALDKFLELALPPFSLIAIGCVTLLLVQGLLLMLGLPITGWIVATALLTLLAILFPFLGLAMTGAPRHAYKAMIAGPFYVLWRVWIGLVVRVRHGSVSWVRTKRIEPEP